MDGAKTRTKRRFLKTRPDARTEAQKEDMSGETRTYGNPRLHIAHAVIVSIGHSTCELMTKAAFNGVNDSKEFKSVHVHTK